MPGLAQAPDGLEQPEGLLDALALPLAERVARMAGRPAVEVVGRFAVFWALCRGTPRARTCATESGSGAAFATLGVYVEGHD